jgi:hypothetical protein
MQALIAGVYLNTENCVRKRDACMHAAAFLQLQVDVQINTTGGINKQLLFLLYLTYSTDLYLKSQAP